MHIKFLKINMSSNLKSEDLLEVRYFFYRDLKIEKYKIIVFFHLLRVSNATPISVWKWK